MGVYAIVNTISDTVYYGKSVKIFARLGQHKSDLVCGRHDNKHLQASWNKYGEDAFVFVPYLYAPEGVLGSVEQRCISEAYGLGLKLFNKTLGGDGGSFGIKQTPEHIEKRMAKLRGRPRSKEWGRRISAALKANGVKPPPYDRIGMRHSKETCRKRGDSIRRLWATEEFRETMSHRKPRGPSKKKRFRCL